MKESRETGGDPQPCDRGRCGQVETGAAMEILQWVHAPQVAVVSHGKTLTTGRTC